jgi:hypothetical protein
LFVTGADDAVEARFGETQGIEEFFFLFIGAELGHFGFNRGSDDDAFSAFGLCLGCGRTVDEITRWSSMNMTERTRVMAELPARLATHSGAKPAAALG